MDGKRLLFFLDEFFLFSRYQYAVLAFIPFAAGCFAAGRFLDHQPIAALLTGLACAGPVIHAVLKGLVPRRFLLWLLLFPAGYLWTLHAFSEPLRSGFSGLYNEKTEIQGIVSSEPFLKKNYLTFELDDLSSNGKTLSGRMLVRLKGYSEKDLYYGDRVRLRCRIEEPQGARNPGAFNYRKYLHSQGVFATATLFQADGVLSIERGEGAGFMGRVVIPLRRYIRNACDAYVGDKAYITIGLLLGEKRDLPDDVRLEFRNTGLMHILAVSGLNVAMLILIFFQIFTAFFMPRRPKILLTLALVWLYALLTGMSASVVRATVMGSVILVGMALERKPSIYNSLSVAALALLVVNPLNLYDPGFLLSFGATFGLVYGYPRLQAFMPGLKEWHFIPKSITESILLSLAATLGTIPILAWYFNQIAWISLFANLIVVPITFLILGLGLLIVFTGFWPALADAYGTSAYFLTEINGKIVSFFAAIPGGYAECAVPEVITIVFYMIGIFCLLNVKESAWARKGVVFSVLIFLLVTAWKPLMAGRPDAQVTFLDVGQGDCIVIELASGHTVLVDGGKKDERMDFGERVVYPFLRSKGISRLDLVILTHSDGDHLGGLLYVLERLKTDKVLEPQVPDSSELYQKFLEIIREKGVQYVKAEAGMRFIFSDSVRLDILHPRIGQQPESQNDASVTARLAVGGQSVLLTGDLETPGEGVVLAGGSDVRSTVLKIGHHGANTSTGEAFLDAVAPEIAVIQVGKWNSYGHPRPETLERLKARGIKVFRTDLTGAVTVVFKQGNKLFYTSD